MDEFAIQRYARRLRVAVLATFAVLVVAIVGVRLGIPPIGTIVHVQSRFPASSALLRVYDGVLILFGLAIYWLSEALRAIAAGGLFSAAVVRRFRLFALWLLMTALFSSLAPLLTEYLEGTPHVGHRLLILLDLRDVLLIGITLLLLLIARMFERAQAIQDEMSEIV